MTNGLTNYRRFLAVCLYCGRAMYRSDWRSDCGSGRVESHVSDGPLGSHQAVADEATVREVSEAEYEAARA